MGKWQRIAEVLSQPIGSSGHVMGWVRSVRSQKTHSFLDLDDGGPNALQIVTTPDHTQGLITGCSVSVQGEVVSGPKNKELHAKEITLLGGSAGTYPLGKKAHSLEHLRDYPQFRARTKTIAAALRLRSAASLSIHHFFTSQDFIHIHTPILTSNDCEGAGELFQVTPSNFFSRPAFLTVSGQLQAEIFASALSRVYTFGPTFRAENSHTQRHLAEFWMVEPEVAGFDLEDTCELAKDMVTSVTKDLLTTSGTDIDSLGSGNRSRLERFLNTKFAYLTYKEAIKVVPNGKPGSGLTTEQERFLTVMSMQDQYCKGPVFVTHYPGEITPFYMKKREGETRNFDMLIPEVAELIGGSEREDDLARLEAAMEGMDKESMQWYLDLRRYGSVPHAGFGMGLERFLLHITGLSNVREVIPVPRSPNNLLC